MAGWTAAATDFTGIKETLAVCGGVALTVGVIVWMIRRGVYEGTRAARRMAGAAPTSPAERPTHGFPVEGTGGWYRVAGVDRETLQDVVKEVEARSAANAQAKAGLMGIVVTEVEFVPPPVTFRPPGRNPAGVRVQNLSFPEDGQSSPPAPPPDSAR